MNKELSNLPFYGYFNSSRFDLLTLLTITKILLYNKLVVDKSWFQRYPSFTVFFNLPCTQTLRCRVGICYTFIYIYIYMYIYRNTSKMHITIETELSL